MVNVLPKPPTDHMVPKILRCARNLLKVYMPVGFQAFVMGEIKVSKVLNCNEVIVLKIVNCSELFDTIIDDYIC